MASSGEYNLSRLHTGPHSQLQGYIMLHHEYFGRSSLVTGKKINVKIGILVTVIQCLL